jgi:gamma-glutamylcyclotransferase (GGCT)/AIG2-like uncharacterized protein YtfP
MVNTNGKVRIFVYGSLKTDLPNNILLQKADAVRVGLDSIVGEYKMLDFGAFPALIYGDKGTPLEVKGEVWAGDEDMLASIDMLENHPVFFSRSKTVTEGGLRVWVYLLKEEWENEAEDYIEDGLWLPNAEEKERWADNG